MSKSWIRCSREIRSLTNELHQMKRVLEIPRWFVAGVIILLSLLFIWMMRKRRSQSNGRTDSTSGTSVETISAQSRPSDSPRDVSEQCLKRTCCRASTEAISCCLVPTLFLCTSPVWIAMTHRTRPIFQQFPELQKMVQAWWTKLQRPQG